MTVSIESLSPTAGHTGGKTLVLITGTGFAVASTPPPNANGFTPAPPPAVWVWFGGVPALSVAVLSDTELYATTPALAPTADETGRGTLPTVVDVVVANLDAFGAPILSELATAASAYSFVLPNLTDPEQESDLARLIRTWLTLLRAQVTPNVSWPKNTDFDQDTGDLLSVTDLPALPGLVVSSVTVRENDFYARRDPYYVDNGDGSFTQKAPPDTVDLVFSIVGVSNNPVELLNLAAAFKRFLRKNPYVTMARDPSGVVPGSVKYDLEWHEGRDLPVTSLANANNLSHFVYDVAILGFDIEDMPGLPLGGPSDTGRAHEATQGISYEAETITVLSTLPLPKSEGAAQPGPSDEGD